MSFKNKVKVKILRYFYRVSKMTHRVEINKREERGTRTCSDKFFHNFKNDT